MEAETVTQVMMIMIEIYVNVLIIHTRISARRVLCDLTTKSVIHIFSSANVGPSITCDSLLRKLLR
jgi:hypothetical protein